MERDKQRKVFIIQERRKTVGWLCKTDREEGKCEGMINDGGVQDLRSSSNHSCHGNPSFLSTDCRLQDEEWKQLIKTLCCNVIFDIALSAFCGNFFQV